MYLYGSRTWPRFIGTTGDPLDVTANVAFHTRDDGPCTTVLKVERTATAYMILKKANALSSARPRAERPHVRHLP